METNPHSWLDKHVEVWYSIHYKRPARIVREVGTTICNLINFTYDNQDSREEAKAYAESQLTEKIMNRTHLEDNLQRLENERAMTCDPCRLNDLDDSIKTIRAVNIAEYAKRGLGAVVNWKNK